MEISRFKKVFYKYKKPILLLVFVTAVAIIVLSVKINKTEKILNAEDLHSLTEEITYNNPEEQFIERMPINKNHFCDVIQISEDKVFRCYDIDDSGKLSFSHEY